MNQACSVLELSSINTDPGKVFNTFSPWVCSKKTKAVTFRKTFRHLHSSEARGFEHHHEGNHGRVASLGGFSSAVLPETEGDAGHSMPESRQGAHSQHPGFRGKSKVSNKLSNNTSAHMLYLWPNSQPTTFTVKPVDQQFLLSVAQGSHCCL